VRPTNETGDGLRRPPCIFDAKGECGALHRKRHLMDAAGQRTALLLDAPSPQEPSLAGGPRRIRVRVRSNR
jgi:hypothetical protein